MKTTNYEKAVKLNEQFKGIEAITKRANPEQLEIVKKIRERRSKSDAMPVREFCNELIIARLENIARAMPYEQYSMGSKIEVWFNGLKGVHDRRSYYSKSCKYRENHGYVGIHLNMEELKSTKVIGGLVTYIYPYQKSNVKKCWWYDSKGKYSKFELIKRIYLVRRKLKDSPNILTDLEKIADYGDLSLKDKMNDFIKLKYSTLKSNSQLIKIIGN